MPEVMTMPKIGVNMADAIIVDWLVKPGDRVNEGDPLFNAETDKAIQEIPATISGVLAKILVQEGDTVNLQDPVAIFLEEGEELSEQINIANIAGIQKSNNDNQISSVKLQPDITTGPEKIAVNLMGEKRVKISPLAKKMAKEMGVDYRLVHPKNSDDRITKADILTFASYRKSVTETEATTTHESGNNVSNTIAYSGTRKTIGNRMLESVSAKPSVPLTVTADVTNLLKWRNELKNDGKNVSYNDMLVVIVAQALKEFPILNSKLAEPEIQLLQDINIGVAVDAEKGLVVPVIRSADKKGLLEISEDLQTKLEHIKAGEVMIEEITNGTFTITNLGMFDIEQFSPIINPPESAILAVGSIARQPVVIDENDTIEVRPMMKMTLVFDHRIVDGGPAARFLQRVKHLVEKPLKLIN